MPSFSSTRSLMREMVSSDSISISISLPVSVFTLICRADDDRTSARVKKNHRKMQNVCMHAARTQVKWYGNEKAELQKLFRDESSLPFQFGYAQSGGHGVLLAAWREQTR